MKWSSRHTGAQFNWPLTRVCSPLISSLHSGKVGGGRISLIGTSGRFFLLNCVSSSYSRFLLPAQQAAERRECAAEGALHQPRVMPRVPETPTLFKRMISVLATPIRCELQTDFSASVCRHKFSCSLIVVSVISLHALVDLVAGPKPRPAANKCWPSKYRLLGSRLPVLARPQLMG